MVVVGTKRSSPIMISRWTHCLFRHVILSLWGQRIPLHIPKEITSLCKYHPHMAPFVVKWVNYIISGLHSMISCNNMHSTTQPLSDFPRECSSLACASLDYQTLHFCCCLLAPLSTHSLLARKRACQAAPNIKNTSRTETALIIKENRMH